MKSNSSSITKARPRRSGATRERRLAPVHPGEILRTEFLDTLGLSAYRVAKDLGVTLPRLNDILLGKRGVSPEMAVLLAWYFQTSEAFFMNLQCDFDRRLASHRLRAKLRRIQPVSRTTGS